MARTQKIQDQVEGLRVQDGGRLKIFSSRRGSRKHENSGTDNGADAERSKRPRPQRFTEPVRRVLRLRDQFVDGLAAECLIVGGADNKGCWLSEWLRQEFVVSSKLESGMSARAHARIFAANLAAYRFA